MIPNKNTGGYFATHYDEIITGSWPAMLALAGCIP